MSSKSNNTKIFNQKCNVEIWSRLTTTGEIISALQRHVDDCLAALMLHCDVDPSEFNAASWKILIAMAKEKSAFEISMAPPNEISADNEKISDLCIVMTHIRRHSHSSYEEILETLINDSFAKDGKLAFPYEWARSLIPPRNPKGRPKGSASPTVKTRQAGSQSRHYRCFQYLEEAKNKGDLEDFIEKKAAGLIFPKALLAKWVNDLLDAAPNPDRQDYIRWAYNRVAGRAEHRIEPDWVSFDEKNEYIEWTQQSQPPYAGYFVVDPNWVLLIDEEGIQEVGFDPFNRDNLLKGWALAPCLFW